MQLPHQLPVNHLVLSKWLDRTIKSPIWIDNLENMGIEKELFIDTCTQMFRELPPDAYDVKRQQIEWLFHKFPEDTEAIQQLYKPYYLGETTISNFSSYLDRLSDKDRQHFDSFQPWRWRSVSQFIAHPDTGQLKRERVESFAQEVEVNDVRSWPRVFSEAPKHHVDNPLFKSFLLTIARKVQKFSPKKVKTVRFVVHFMSVKATIQTAGDNSPEGAHEDGADFIVSALVINRRNLKGGESQIIEKFKDGSKEIIYSRILQPGEFVFQADTGDEKTYGNDLWHHVTPFFVDAEDQEEGWRDIIGFDINIVE